MESFQNPSKSWKAANRSHGGPIYSNTMEKLKGTQYDSARSPGSGFYMRENHAVYLGVRVTVPY